MIFTWLKKNIRKLVRNMFGIFDKYIVTASEKRYNGFFHRTLLWLINTIRMVSILVRDRHPGRMQVWQAQDKISGQLMKVGYICDQKASELLSPEYLKHILFENNEVMVEDRGEILIWQSQQAAQALAKEVDLVLIERNRLSGWKPEYGKWSQIPLWVHLTLDLSHEKTWKQIERGMYMHATNIKKVRRNGYTFEFSHREEDFDLFYDRMLIPTVKQRFNEFGMIKPKSSFHGHFLGGGVMLVRQPSGQPVAGQLTYFIGNTAFSVANGVLDGNFDLYDQGAMSAVYYFCLQWCYENGIAYMDAGGCRPFTNDGVFQYKHRWGFSATPDQWNVREWLFWIPNGSQTAANWANANPCLNHQAEESIWETQTMD